MDFNSYQLLEASYREVKACDWPDYTAEEREMAIKNTLTTLPKDSPESKTLRRRSSNSDAGSSSSSGSQRSSNLGNAPPKTANKTSPEIISTSRKSPVPIIKSKPANNSKATSAHSRSASTSSPKPATIRHVKSASAVEAISNPAAVESKKRKVSANAISSPEKKVKAEQFAIFDMLNERAVPSRPELPKKLESVSENTKNAKSDAVKKLNRPVAVPKKPAPLPKELDSFKKAVPNLSKPVAVENTQSSLKRKSLCITYSLTI